MFSLFLRPFFYFLPSFREEEEKEEADTHKKRGNRKCLGRKKGLIIFEKKEKERRRFAKIALRARNASYVFALKEVLLSCFSQF